MIGRFFLVINELSKSSNGGLSPDGFKFRTQAHDVQAWHRYTHEQAARFIDTTIEPIDGFKWAPAQKGWTGQLERADVRWRKMVDSTNPGTLVLPELKYMHMGQNELIEVTERAKSCSGVPLRAALLHLVPSIPDTDEFTLQNYYRSRLRDWNTQRVLVVNDLSRYARSVDGNRS
ncbi:hypothetical protein PSTT_01050 [Puccinia striiformis]|uniref:Uncharacterized protein n=2 Tax=Puccinia striiformis TaxID=27350 RepID=A0A0L0V9S9_9BASI|nr:hypothetical protein PSTG_10614 [Puccinia striiformis f. sp. tritici PST-78]POW16795.1 hypothetical protein PSTT_01050 [Puccinia striiformis]